jgi:hypothetical protein
VDEVVSYDHRFNNRANRLQTAGGATSHELLYQGATYLIADVRDNVTSPVQQQGQPLERPADSKQRNKTHLTLIILVLLMNSRCLVELVRTCPVQQQGQPLGTPAHSKWRSKTHLTLTVLVC